MHQGWKKSFLRQRVTYLQACWLSDFRILRFAWIGAGLIMRELV